MLNRQRYKTLFEYAIQEIKPEKQKGTTTGGRFSPEKLSARVVFCHFVVSFVSVTTPQAATYYLPKQTENADNTIIL